MINYKPVFIALAALALAACTTTVSEMVGYVKDDAATAVPTEHIKPELDYSDESPDCVTAGQRLAENVQLGMSLKEVIRLVGKPKIKAPGSWWWSSSFSEKGVPVVKFQFGHGANTSPVTDILSDTENCRN